MSIEGQRVVLQLLQNWSCRLTLSGIQLNMNKKNGQLQNFESIILWPLSSRSVCILQESLSRYFNFSFFLFAKPIFGYNNRAWSTHVFVLYLATLSAQTLLNIFYTGAFLQRRLLEVYTVGFHLSWTVLSVPVLKELKLLQS